MIFVNIILRVVFLALSVVAAVLCLHIDVNIFRNGISEYSLTEIVQESILAVIIFIHLMRAINSSKMRLCNVLIAGFFTAMLIRELDAVFDLISHGSWVWFALAVSFATLLYVLRHPRQILAELAEYIENPSYGLMISGLLAILVFSRVFGMSILWQSILQEGYVREVKNMVEEGSELFGYMLCLCASIGILNIRSRK